MKKDDEQTPSGGKPVKQGMLSRQNKYEVDIKSKIARENEIYHAVIYTTGQSVTTSIPAPRRMLKFIGLFSSIFLLISSLLKIFNVYWKEKVNINDVLLIIIIILVNYKWYISDSNACIHLLSYYKIINSIFTLYR